MQRLELTPGMRVRCVDASGFFSLRVGDEYTVDHVWRRQPYRKSPLIALKERTGNFYAHRFKPVVRVRASYIYSGAALDLLVKRAVTAFEALSPEEKKAHREAQRASWARGEAALAAVGHR